ncbi:sigma-54-dependent Fis family transcriptional regulator [Azoarcus sp. DD4]|uniref:sigma-54-dependent Fis family transcriptional regulator n=1 Tax=Azoarcus sp. DD4 TaxID=2027405 RepID=UPI00112687D7|nr:sigma-54-dependent Fis family transcriptional regulator [Azoarcus sp. DD4]QDF98354.1 sigma-54-dependent Fis family transcriptional regulator [Azoarcus sp. DD4]
MKGQLMAMDAHVQQVQAARRRFFDRGEEPEGDVPSEVLRSWLRCRDGGVDALAVGNGDPEGRAQLTEARERSEQLLNHAAGIMEHVFEQIRASGSMVILADLNGVILHSLGDPDFVARAQRVALQPGASWDESLRGTNAIGTALIERMPVEVLGAEHFLERNGVLTCSAAPVFKPCGGLAGVLDISGDYRSNQRHTMGLVRLSAQLLEKRLFEVEFARQILIAVHARPECVGSLQEGLLAVSLDGCIVGANPVAREALGIGEMDPGGLAFGNVFRVSLDVFFDRSRRDPGSLQAMEARRGERVYARLKSNLPPRTEVPAPSPARPAVTARAVAAEAPCDPKSGRVTLACLATGDARLQLALDRSSRVLGKDIPLLIQGESGVGKELFARAFHYSGPRRDGPFVALNCAAIPENLIESELFGYVGGAFTGARREGAIGKIQQAHGGTLFLDEIGDMPLGMQARLLRVLQERSVTPIGAMRQVPVDISLVCATHRLLRDAVQKGSFREDLYYRVNGLTVTLPPLRERSDIGRIVDNILAAEVGESRTVHIGAEVMAFFERYPWPGNVRQLQNVIRVAVALLDEGEDEIRPVHLPEELFGADAMDEGESARIEERSLPRQPAAATPVAAAPAIATGGRSLDQIELEAIAVVMREVGGNVSAAARRLGISRNTLYRKIGRIV